jgi:hypothetical protein
MVVYAKYQAEHGEPHPHMKLRPNLTPHQAKLWQAFLEVARSRLTDQGYRPLNDDDVLRWCARRHRSSSYGEYLWWHIQRLDDCWLGLMGEKREREMEMRQAMAGLSNA